MTSTEIRDRRRTLRYHGLLVKQMVQMKNRISGLLMEAGVSYNKQRLHKVGYFSELMSGNEQIDCVRPLLKLSRETINRSQKLDYALVSSLERDPLLAERLKRLRRFPEWVRLRRLLGFWRSAMWHAFNRSSRPSVVADCAEPRGVQQTRSCARRYPSNATNTFSRYWSKRRSWHHDTAMNWP